MAHFLKGDTDNKKIDKILQKAEDIDLSEYVEKGSAPELDYIYLEEHDETQSSGDDGVLENIDGALYLNGEAIGGGGIQNTATGTNALAISGDDSATATKASSLSIGYSSKSTGMPSVAVGIGADASGNNGLALGGYAKAGGYGSICLGFANGTGNNSKATGEYSIAIGALSTNATGKDTIAIGRGNTVSQESNIAIGNGINADKINSIGIGKNITFNVKNGVAIGIGFNKIVDHEYAVIFDRIKFIPLAANETYTLADTDYGLLCDSNGVSYKAPFTTITTTGPSLLIIWV